MGRAPCCEKVGLKKGRWTAEEDEILVRYIAAKGEGSWRSLPKNAGLLRCGKSCRLRWINYLRSDLKRGNFTKEDEDLILKLHATLGNRWSLIASYLPGRTDNEIKNYWNAHLCRKIYSSKPTGIHGESAATATATQVTAKPSGKVKQRGGSRMKPKQQKKKKTAKTETITREDQDILIDSPPESTSVQNNESVALVDAEQNQDSSTVTFEGVSIAEMEDMLFGNSSEESNICGSWLHEGGCGVLSSSEEREESGATVLNEQGKAGALLGFDIEWEGMDAKLWDEAGEMWPWMWDDEVGELGLQPVDGSGRQEESLAGWFI